MATLWVRLLEHLLALVVGGRTLLEGGHELAGGERSELVVADVVEVVLGSVVGSDYPVLEGAASPDPASHDGHDSQCPK